MIFLSFILVSQFNKDKNLWRITIAIGLSGMGVLEGFHSISIFGNQFVLLHLLAVFGGSCWFAATSSDKQARNVIKFNQIYWINFIGLTVLGIMIIVFREFIPIMQIDGKFTNIANLISILSSFFYLIAAYNFYTMFIANKNLELYILSLSSLLFTIASIAFMSSHMWSAGWWFWHFMRLGSFIALGSIILLKYKQSNDDLLKSESRIKSNQHYFHLLINSTAEGIYGLDLNGNFTFCNQAGIKMFGYKNEKEILDKNMHDLVHSNLLDGSHLQVLDCKICRAIREGQEIHLTEKFCRKDNTSFDAEYWAHTILIDNERTGSVVTFFDITERKLTENLLKKNQEKFQDLIERSSDGIYVLQNNKFVFINPMFTKIMGYQLEDISGEDFELEQILPDEGMQVIKEREEKMRMGEKLSNRYGFKSYRQNHEIVDINVSISNIDWEGQPAILGMIQDESERIKYQNELVEALNKAEESQRLKSFFLSNISHELRTPLNAIVGFSDLIRQETHHMLDESMREFFDIIEQSSNRLMNTVHNILNISLLETGEIDFVPKQVNLVSIIERTIKMVKLDAERKQIGIIYENRLNSIPIIADENLLFNALTNLVDNAIKYTKKGCVSVVLEKNSDFLHLTIADTGIGMSEEYMAKLYGVFSQESQGFNKKYQGIGLGLAIAKRALDLHNVDVSVESEKGVGTTFTLSFLLTGSEKGAQA